MYNSRSRLLCDYFLWSRYNGCLPFDWLSHWWWAKGHVRWLGHWPSSSLSAHQCFVATSRERINQRVCCRALRLESKSREWILRGLSTTVFVLLALCTVQCSLWTVGGWWSILFRVSSHFLEFGECSYWALSELQLLMGIYIAGNNSSCEHVDCWKGTCAPATNLPWLPQYSCNCDQGWLNLLNLSYFACGVPNCEFLSSKLISVVEGILLVMWSESQDCCVNFFRCTTI